MSQIRGLLRRMIGFINTSVTHALLITINYKQYSAIVHLHQLPPTVAHALGYTDSTSRLPATAFNTTIPVLHFHCYTQVSLVITRQFFRGCLLPITLENSWEPSGVLPMSRHITSAPTAQKTSHAFLIVACWSIAAELRSNAEMCLLLRFVAT
jgi:hypothetical protein